MNALYLVFTVTELWRAERVILTPSQITTLVMIIINLHTILLLVWIKHKPEPTVTSSWQTLFFFGAPPMTVTTAPKELRPRERIYIIFTQLTVAGLLIFATYSLLAFGPQPCSWPDGVLGRSGCAGTLRSTMLFGDQPTQLVRSPDGSLLAVSYFASHVDILRRDGTRLHRLNHSGAWTNAVAFSPDGTLLAAADTQGVLLWSVRDGTLLRTIPAPGPNQVVAFSPDSLLLLGDAGDGKLTAWRISDGTPARTFAPALQDAAASVLAVSPDGTMIAAGLISGQTKEVWVWRWSDGTVLQRFPELSTQDLAFAPDNRTLGIATWRNQVGIWDLSSGQQRYNLPSAEEDEGPVRRLAFSPDGAAVAAGSDDGFIRVWRTADGAPLHTFRYTSDVEGLVFDTDGQTLISANNDDSIRLWRLPR
ncbi:MAG: hypothetical protein OHK0022_28770 [Roseiflexaceae bacterium]